MIRNVIRSAIQNAPRMSSRSYAIYGPANYKPPTMDDLPVPQGSWQEAYDKKQQRYNILLAASIVFTIATITVAKVTGLVYLNWYPPTRKEAK